MNTILAIFLGGGLGAIARYGVGRLSLNLISSSLPVGTFIANILSCVVLGLVVYFVEKERISGFWTPFLIIGFCGGFSTFSTFSFETMYLIQQGKYLWAGANVFFSVAICIIILIVLSKNMS